MMRFIQLDGTGRDTPQPMVDKLSTGDFQIVFAFAISGLFLFVKLIAFVCIFIFNSL